MMIINIVLVAALILCIVVCIWGFAFFEEWEMGIEFLPKDYNNFELGVSNRNYHLDNGGMEQELRIGLLLFSFIFLFRRFDA